MDFAWFGVLYVFFHFNGLYCEECFQGSPLKEIPADHLYHKLHHPVVVGHMGNIEIFQENTLGGIKSLVEIKAGGVYIHARLTKDKRLIVFQDDNLLRLTGENHDVQKLPYSEIKKMNLLKTVNYYKVHDDPQSGIVKSYDYKKTSKIPLLATVLEYLRGKGLLVYIEMMPAHIPPTGPLDRYYSIKTGELLSQMIKKYSMENEILVVSRDAFKLLALAHHHSSVASAWPIERNLYNKTTSQAIKEVYNDLPPINTDKCFEKPGSTAGTTGHAFVKSLVSTGIISKAVNASFVDLSIDVYDDDSYFHVKPPTSIKDVLSNNYGQQVSIGVFNVLMGNTITGDVALADQKENDKKVLTKVVALGATRIVTSDVNRVKRALDEVTTTYSTGNTLHNYVQVFLITLLFGKMVVTVLCI